MRRFLALLFLTAVGGFILAGCGTSYGPGGAPGANTSNVNSGQDTNAQPESGARQRR